MVWGLVDPNGFGDFFPYGDEVGWEEHIPVPYYGMVIRRFIDSFVPEQSNRHQGMELTEYFYTIHPTKRSFGDLAVSKNVVAGHHLWRERRLRRPDIFLSDELQAEIARRGLRIPKHHQLKSV